LRKRRSLDIVAISNDQGLESDNIGLRESIKTIEDLSNEIKYASIRRKRRLEVYR